MPFTSLRNLAAIIAISLLPMSYSASVYAIDWSAVPGKDIVLFYPAQLSWEWLTDDDEHSGADKIAEGRTCRSCHDGKEAESGALLVDYRPTEPAVIPDKPGSIKAEVKAARDDQSLYIQVKFNASSQPNAKQDNEFSDKVAVMIDDGSVEESKRVGCWIACHTDANTMKNGSLAKTKYIVAPNASFLEYWQARLRTDTRPQVSDGIVVSQRSANKNPLTKVDAAFDNGTWTVLFSRGLRAADGHKAFVSGKTYTLGFAIHAGHTAHRFHYVSFEKTLTLDGDVADFIARSE